LLDQFTPDYKNPVDEFKKVHQIGKVDDYIISYKHVKPQVAAKQVSDEEIS
jgi:hypothetical protein